MVNLEAIVQDKAGTLVELETIEEDKEAAVETLKCMWAIWTQTSTIKCS